MALRIKRIKSGTFFPSSNDITSSKTLVDQQLGFEHDSGNLKICTVISPTNPTLHVIDAMKNIEGNSATSTNATNHIANKSNPHSVTKEQLGLGNVENVKQYSASNPPPYVYKLAGEDTRNVNWQPQQYFPYAIGFKSEFKSASTIGISGVSYCLLLTNVPWGDATGGLPSQVAYLPNGRILTRYGTSATAWSSWAEMYTTLNPPSASDVSAVPTSRTVNGKALSSNISLSASDVSAVSSTPITYLTSGYTFSQTGLYMCIAGSTSSTGSMSLTCGNGGTGTTITSSVKVLIVRIQAMGCAGAYLGYNGGWGAITREWGSGQQARVSGSYISVYKLGNET